MSFFENVVRRFSGPSHNAQFAEHLKRLGAVAKDCAAHFRKTEGQDLKSIIAYEHQGDAIVEDIHELLDDAFIFRFDIADSMQLTDDLDNVIDGMRKSAFHIDIYRPILDKLTPEAMELFTIGETMIADVCRLVDMLSEPKLPLQQVRELARVVDEGESKADKLVADAERQLVRKYAVPQANRLEFIAWDKLYQLLEETTDEANHCAKLIMSLARKEA